MRVIRHCYFLSILLISLSGFAEFDLESTGDLSSVLSLTAKPSAYRDQTNFKNPTGYFNFVVDSDEGVGGTVELSYGRTRSTSTLRSELQVEKAYIQVDDIWENVAFRMGQLPNAWIEMQEREDPFWFYLGPAYQTSTQHWNALYRADSGIGLNYDGRNFRGDVLVTNGEGPGMEEKGPRKELQVHLEGEPFKSFQERERILLAVGYLEGAYENVESEVAQKQRVLAFIKYDRAGQGSFSLEALWTKDAVDAVNGKIADQVDLTAQGGTAIRGFGTATELNLWLGPKILSSLRYEKFNPANGINAKGLSSSLLGFHFFPRQMLQFSLAWLEIQYEQNHAAAVRDTSEIVFGSRLYWP